MRPCRAAEGVFEMPVCARRCWRRRGQWGCPSRRLRAASSARACATYAPPRRPRRAPRARPAHGARPGGAAAGRVPTRADGRAVRGCARGGAWLALLFELIWCSGVYSQPACRLLPWSARPRMPEQGIGARASAGRHAHLRQLLCAGTGTGKHGSGLSRTGLKLRREGRSRVQSQARLLRRRCVIRPRCARGRAGVRGGCAVAGCGIWARGAGHIRAGVALHAAQVRLCPKVPVLPPMCCHSRLSCLVSITCPSIVKCPRPLGQWQSRLCMAHVMHQAVMLLA